MRTLHYWPPPYAAPHFAWDLMAGDATAFVRFLVLHGVPRARAVRAEGQRVLGQRVSLQGVNEQRMVALSTALEPFFPAADVARLLTVRPTLVHLPPDALAQRVRDMLAVLERPGRDPEHSRRAIVQHPVMLSFSPGALQQRIAGLAAALDLSPEQVAARALFVPHVSERDALLCWQAVALVLRKPSLVTRSVGALTQVVDAIASLLSVPRTEVLQWCHHTPYLLTSTLASVTGTVRFLGSLGFADSDVLRLVRAAPGVLLLHPERTLRPKLHFLTANGMDFAALIVCPVALLYSLRKRIVPRVLFLRRMGAEQRLTARVLTTSVADFPALVGATLGQWVQFTKELTAADVDAALADVEGATAPPGQDRRADAARAGQDES